MVKQTENWTICKYTIINGRKRAPQGGFPYDVLLQWVNILKCFSFFLSIVQKIYLTQPLNHFENSNRSLQFSWRFFKILLFFGMSCYPCENFQLFILYNFLFRHMVWKRFPTALNSYSIFMRKGGKSRKSNFGNEKLFRMSSYTCEDFQDEIPDILSHDQKHHFHFGRKKQDVWESFFLVGPIFNQKRPFLFEVDFFLVRLIFDEKRPFFLVRVFFNEKRLFYLLTFFLGETYP